MTYWRPPEAKSEGQSEGQKCKISSPPHCLVGEVVDRPLNKIAVSPQILLDIFRALGLQLYLSQPVEPEDICPPKVAKVLGLYF